MKRRPAWWAWDLELSPHVLKRMADRDFTELDLRTMLQSVTRVRRGLEPGRWIASTRLRRHRWDVILEPDPDLQRLVVITAYPLTP
jgi:hypothetical protein